MFRSRGVHRCDWPIVFQRYLPPRRCDFPLQRMIVFLTSTRNNRRRDLWCIECGYRVLTSLTLTSVPVQGIYSSTAEGITVVQEFICDLSGKWIDVSPSSGKTIMSAPCVANSHIRINMLRKTMKLDRAYLFTRFFYVLDVRIRVFS